MPDRTGAALIQIKCGEVLFGKPEKENPPRFPGGGFSKSIIVMRSFPSLSDLAATYSSKP